DSIFDTVYISETVNIPMIDLKVSYDIKSVNRISENSENSELSCNKKPVTVSNRFSENSKSSYKREPIANTPIIFSEDKDKYRDYLTNYK
ncbi:9726_t:CDS:1, partial [Funneliformis geosporum]